MNQTDGDDADLTRALATEIRHWRGVRGMSTQRLSEECGRLGRPVPRNTLANLESGRRTTVTVGELMVIAKALDVPPLLLIVPVGRSVAVSLVPGHSMPTADALAWVTGNLVRVRSQESAQPSKSTGALSGPPRGFEAGLSRLREYTEANGHVNVPRAFVTDDGYELGNWLSHQRAYWKQGRLADERIAALEALGVDRDRRQARWDAGLESLAEYIAEHGKTPPARAGAGFWYRKQMQARAKGKLSPDRARRLDEVLAAVGEESTTQIARVVRVVTESPVPLRPADVAALTALPHCAVGPTLVVAASAGRIARVGRGLYGGVGTASPPAADPDGA